MPTVGTADPLRIVVGHGAVDVLDPDRHNRAAIALAPLDEELAAGRIHYVALGDRHSRTSVGDSGAVWYAGTPEVTDHRETRPGDVLVVELAAGQPPSVTPHHVGTWSFRTIRREVAGARDVSALARELAALPDKDRTVVRLALRGVLGVADHAALTDLLEAQGAVFAALHQWERHTSLGVTADAAELSDLHLGGFVSAAAEEMRVLAVQDTPEGMRELTQQGSPEGPDGPTDEAVGALPAWPSDEHPDEEPGPHESADPLAWEFTADGADDEQSAADALSLLYRLVREEAR